MTFLMIRIMDSPIRYLTVAPARSNSRDLLPWPGLYNGFGILLMAIRLKLTTSTSCLDDSLTITVAMPSLPITISPDQTIFIGQKIQLFVNGPGTTYIWSPATGLSSTTVARPLASPVQDITYKATVINDNGCSGEDSVRITVVDLDGIYVPTAFTPNNDGKNDDIRPFFGTKFTLKEFSIFGRWGAKDITTSTRDEGWER